MKNEKLKNLVARKIATGKQNAPGVTILNKEALMHAMGGGSPCPNLTSCGTYDVCGVKVKFDI